MLTLIFINKLELKKTQFIYKLSLFFFLIVVLLFLSISCKRILFGIRKPNSETYTEQIKHLKKLKVDTNNLMFIKFGYFDSLSYANFSLDSFNSNSFSPIQYRVYDSLGKFLGGWQLCYGNIDRLGMLDKYPPVSDRFPVNSNLSFTNDTSFFISDSRNIIPEINKFNLVIVVFWAKYLGKYSDDLLVKIDNYIKNNNEKKILLIKVNYTEAFRKNN